MSAAASVAARSSLTACLLVLLAGLLAGGGCAAKKDSALNDLNTLGENEIYNRAQLRMRSGNFIGATDLFRVLLRRYPFGRYAEQAQIELVYAHFMSYQVEEARTEAERFLRLYPQHQNADYARFIHAYATFHRDDSVSSKAFRLNYARRDVSLIRKSFEELSEFLNLHSESLYASLARRRMLQLKEMLAYHELWVAHFYLERGAFLAAVNRTDWVLKHIPSTSATPWALALMSRAYNRMDLPDEAHKPLLVLRKNFPGHPSLKGDQLADNLPLPNDERSVTSILTLGLFDRAQPDKPLRRRIPPPPRPVGKTPTTPAPNKIIAPVQPGTQG